MPVLYPYPSVRNPLRTWQLADLGQLVLSSSPRTSGSRIDKLPVHAQAVDLGTGRCGPISVALIAYVIEQIGALAPIIQNQTATM